MEKKQRRQRKKETRKRAYKTGGYYFKEGNKEAVGIGRPPKVIELKARELVLSCINGEEGVRAIIIAAFKKAKAGSIRHQELLLNYILGKPVERLKLEQHGQAILPSPGVVKVIADHLRLEKLNADVKAAPIISQDRIDEMERILNKEI